MQKPELTHLQKIFFPERGYVKGDIVNYYMQVANYILPYLKDRPLSLLRQPNGISGQSFFQKNNTSLPNWVKHADIFSDSNNANLRWIVGDDLNTLLYLVQLGCIEINPWSSRIQNLQNPDWLVLDLDPEQIEFKYVVIVAKEIKKLCDELKIPCYPKTTGRTGIHVFIPLGAKYEYSEARNFANLIAIKVNQRLPKITSLERSPSKRAGRIYLDYLQNSAGQTLAAPYSLRPTPDATVSTPIDWSEVTSKLNPKSFTILNTLKRLQKTGDIWKPVLKKGINIKTALKNLSADD